MADPIPATGAWRPGDEPGRRQFASLFSSRPHVLEAGGQIENITIAYETWGTLAPDRSNAVLVLHALTGDSHAAGPSELGHPHDGWWSEVIGPGKAIDTDRFYVVCPNVFGGCQGTTGPSSINPRTGKPFGASFPIVTVRDQAVIESALADSLGITEWSALIGGSMGGQRALEWLVSFPNRIKRAVLIACGATATAEEIALSSIQIRAIEADPRWRGGDYYDAAPGDGPHSGLSIARGIGNISYRSEIELDARFGRGHQGDESPLEGGRYAVESYLEYHGEKLARRFDANTYITLSRAMNHHDVGRGRGGVASALARVTAEVTIAGITSDWLYPLRLQHEIASHLAMCPEVIEIESIAGHDGFLVEHDAVSALISKALA